MPTKKSTKKPAAKKAVTKMSAEKAATKKVPAKKPAAKKAVKKATAKKSAPKKATKKDLVYAGDQESFWVTDGQVLNSLLALRDALDQMEAEVYSYHAGKAHNDFADWVESVLADNSCAKDLKKAKTPKSAKTVVVKHLKFYSL